MDRLIWFYSEKAEWTDDAGKRHTGYGSGVHVEAVYDYRAADGTYLYSKIRFEGGKIPRKIIRYYVIDQSGDTAKSGKPDGIPATLYNLPEFLEQREPGKTVFYVEGEKDCCTLKRLKDRRFHLCVTAGSTSDWSREFAPLFKGLRVIILRDNDEAGSRLARQIQNDLGNYAHSIQVVNPSELPGGDVTDFLTKEGGTEKELIEKIGAVPVVYAPWLSSKGRVTTGILADYFQKNEKYFIVRNGSSRKEVVYCYEKGAYRIINDNDLKRRIGEYLPAANTSQNVLSGICDLIHARSTNLFTDEELASREDRRYVNFRNGIFDLEERTLRPHSPGVLSTSQFDFDYQSGNAVKPNFDKYINDLCRDENDQVDEEVKAIIQEFFGLILSGDSIAKVKKMMVLYSSEGNTGKSVLIRLITAMIGPSRIKASNLSKLNPSNRFALSDLPRYRLITCGDESNTCIKDSSVIKALTGDDYVETENKGVNSENYHYDGGLLIACNGLPNFADDKGNHLYERFLIVPCRHHVQKAEIDTEILAKMLPERSAIFNWAIEGYFRLKGNGFRFSESAAQNRTNEEWRAAMDSVYRFLIENYEITRSREDRIKKADFDEAYYRWAKSEDSENVLSVSRRTISKRMEGYGLILDKASGQYVYRGLKRKEEFMDATGENIFE